MNLWQNINLQPQAREKGEKQGFEVSIAKTSFKANTKALAENEGEGLAKVNISIIFLCLHCTEYYVLLLISSQPNSCFNGARLSLLFDGFLRDRESRFTCPIHLSFFSRCIYYFVLNSFMGYWLSFIFVFLQLIYRPDNGEILGVHIFGLHAADLIHEASNAIALGTCVQVNFLTTNHLCAPGSC